MIPGTWSSRLLIMLASRFLLLFTKWYETMVNNPNAVKSRVNSCVLLAVNFWKANVISFPFLKPFISNFKLKMYTLSEPYNFRNLLTSFLQIFYMKSIIWDQRFSHVKIFLRNMIIFFRKILIWSVGLELIKFDKNSHVTTAQTTSNERILKPM